MHAWESIQKTLDYIEEHINEAIEIEELANLAALSLFYYQRLFTRLVKEPVREYIKLRRLARACIMLSNKANSIVDVAMEYGFNSRENFSRAFKTIYGITPAQYRENPVGLNSFIKPDLLLNYVMVDEGVPLISEGIVLEYNRKTLEKPQYFIGLESFMPFKSGRMLGERTGVSVADEIWNNLFKHINKIPHIPGGRYIGVCYKGNAPDGFTTYFAGTEAAESMDDPYFTKWQLPARDYIVCGFEAESNGQLMESLSKAMKFTRFWLKEHGLIADEFFTEVYNHSRQKIAYMEMWLPFKERLK